ncbi:MFS transporter [Paenibacillus alginolyticus]|uniref:MFS transporter n=1 Tax=Paenibacillus alginolyticus TaxID=59839 RepID=UPI000405747A|nr:MFS transporter [Paenibacillus alginolyticus]MCY9666798.1 MFS transporter [Paenibacillus alginolyticus]
MDNVAERNDRRWYVLLTVGIGTFLSSLNTSITNTVLPVIERELHITLGQSEWVALIYLLVLTLFLLPIGRMSDSWGHRQIFLVGFALYSCAAVMCGLSENYISLVWGRAFLGLAGAMILSIVPAIITTTFPAEQRGRVLGIQAIMTYIGLSIGPALGGLLTQIWGWQVTFFVTVPFAMVGLVLGIWAVPQVEVKQTKRIDLKGILLFMIGMATATLLLNTSFITRHRALIITLLLIVFASAAWAFQKLERKQLDPMLDLKLFRIRNFGFGTFSIALNYLCIYLPLFLLPFYLDRVLHLSAAEIGIYMTITPLVMTICAPISGALSDSKGPRLLATLGMIFSTAGLILFGIMIPAFGEHAYWTLIVGLILTGLGTGTFVAPSNSAVMGAVHYQQQGTASGTLATFRYMGMMAGITVGGSLFHSLLNNMAPSATSIQGFLYAFSLVMWVGVVFGVIGIGCTLALTQLKPKSMASSTDDK